MILTRPGNKRRIAQTILPHFPEHDLFIEPFFGAGGMFFSKPKAKHNIVNDYDSEVYNLFRVMVDRMEELLSFWDIMPLHEDLWKFWKANPEGDAIRKAARFLFFSNFSFMCQMKTMMLERTRGDAHKRVAKRVADVQSMLKTVQFTNCDFRQLMPRICLTEADRRKTFIYCDPPYLGTKGGNYEGFSLQDSTDLFDCLVASGCKFAISEFDHPDILRLAAERGLTVIEIGERQNLKNRKMEVLIINY